MVTEHYTKKELRKAMLACRDAMPMEVRKEKSLLMQQALLAHPVYREASQVLSYAHFRSEAETATLLEQALWDKKELYCPRVIGKGPESEMEFYRITDLADLKPGAYGILEPKICEERKFMPRADKKALMVVPGAAFDRNGFRLGYGGGYYDRYLARYLSDEFATGSEFGAAENVNCFTTAAFLFSEQMVNSIPTETHDFAVDLLVTEQGVSQSIIKKCSYVLEVNANTSV